MRLTPAECIKRLAEAAKHLDASNEPFGSDGFYRVNPHELRVALGLMLEALQSMAQRDQERLFP